MILAGCAGPSTEVAAIVGEVDSKARTALAAGSVSAGDAKVGAGRALDLIEVVSQQALGAVSIAIDCEAICGSCLAEQVGEEVIGQAGDAVCRGEALRAANRAGDAGVISAEVVALAALTALVRSNGQGTRVSEGEQDQHRADYVSQYHIYSGYY